MRNNRNDYHDGRNRETEPRWLHEQDHGENSRRGNYRIDTHFNRGYGNYENDFMDDTSFNTHTDHESRSRQGRNQPGGATYSGEDFTSNSDNDNPYGMTHTRNDGYNSDRHYDARADYSNRDYDNLRENRPTSERFGFADERFGHDVRRSGNNNEPFLGHSSIGDYESYRRYEQGNRMYDNDYSGGFAGRNYTEGRDHYGEDTAYNSDWRNNDNTQHHDRYTDRDNDRSRNRR